MWMNVSSIGNAMYSVAADSEYQRIVRELRALGLEPTGDKAADKAKLEAAKAALKSENNQTVIMQPVDASNETDKNRAFCSQDEVKSGIAASAANMTGADQIGQLNKLKLLGMF